MLKRLTRALGVLGVLGLSGCFVYVPAEVRFEAALPENAVGKVDRKALKARV